MNRAIIVGILCIVILFSFSCKKKLVPLEGEMTELSDFKIEEIDFEYLTTKTKFQYTDGKSNVSATANIRVRKDSLIWFSLTPALGIEAARGVITKDSLVIVDRMNKTFSIFTLDELSEKFRFKLDYQLIESLFTGNSTPLVTESGKIKKEGDFFRILLSNGPITLEKHVNGISLKIEKLSMLDELTKNALVVNYGNFKPLGESTFANQTLILLTYRPKEGDPAQNTQINLEHNKADIESKKIKFPFNIPAKYEIR